MVFYPKQMTEKELYQGWLWLQRQQYSREQMALTRVKHNQPQITRRNLLLGLALDGTLWGWENRLGLAELQIRGLVDNQIQRQLDHNYQLWKKEKGLSK